MEQTIGRPRVARAYSLLIALATLQVIVQAFLFAGFYSEGEKGFILKAKRVLLMHMP